MWGPILGWFSNVGATLAGYFGIQLATRTAFYVLASVATVAIFFALASVCTALITSVTVSLSDQWFILGAGLLLPSNTSVCISAYFTASFAKWMARVGLLHVLIASRS